MIRRLTDRAERQFALEFLADRIGTTPRDLVWTYPYEIVGAFKSGDLIGVMLFIHWRGVSVEVHLAGNNGWFTRRVITAMCWFAFEVLQAKRLVGLIEASNITARVAAERTGFVFEGIAREAEDGGDIALYAMLKRECRWLGHGQEKRSEVRRKSSDRSTDTSERRRLQVVGAGGG